MKEITIKAPEGFEIDKYDESTGKITFKKEANEEKKWEDFGEVNGYYINNICDIILYGIEKNPFKSYFTNKNTYPTLELAEAGLALTQLLQWRDKANGDWKADWNSPDSKYIINLYKNNLIKNISCSMNNTLAFKSEEIRDQFLIDHKSLIEIAKPLL